MKYNLFQFLSIMILMLTTLSLSAQSLDEIIQKHIKAHGGVENWEKVEALEIDGKFTAFSVENDFSCLKTKDGAYFADLFLGDKKVIEAFNGETGWTIDPWQDIDFARHLNGEEVNVFQQKATFFTPFYKYKENGLKVELLGEKEIDGIDTYELKLTRPSGKIETWYIDVNTYLEYLCISDWVDFAYPNKSEVYFDDFREVEGLTIPFFTDRTFGQRNRVLQIEKVEINPEYNEKIFEMPRRAEMKKLDFLLGDWDVNFEVWSRRGSWYPLGKTKASIELGSENMIREEISYDRIFRINKTTSYSYNAAAKKYRIVIFNDHYSEFNVFEGDFENGNFLFDDTGISFSSDPKEGKTNIRLTISDINEDSFILEQSMSNDGGETWNPTDRFTYKRAVE